MSPFTSTRKVSIFCRTFIISITLFKKNIKKYKLAQKQYHNFCLKVIHLFSPTHPHKNKMQSLQIAKTISQWFEPTFLFHKDLKFFLFQMQKSNKISKLILIHVSVWVFVTFKERITLLKTSNFSSACFYLFFTKSTISYHLITFLKLIRYLNQSFDDIMF